MTEYPRLVAIETTNHCNAKCVFCPNNALARDKGPMDDDLFEKLVEDCRQFPLEAIEPFIQGDPFSDPKILPRLETIHRRLPKTKLRLYSNGHAMTPKRIDALAEVGLDHLYISLNTLDPDRYEQVMGLSLQRTLDNLEYLTDRSRRKKVARRITFRMTRLEDTSVEEQTKFVEYCRAHGARPFIVGLFNYKGDVNSNYYPVPSYGCEHVERLDILASGRVTLCCMDQDGDYGWGDARESSVLELFNHPMAKRYRDMHRTGKRRDIDPCGTCNNFWPSFRSLSTIDAVRTGIEYCSYVARHRPTGVKRPLNGKKERIPVTSLVTLRRRDDL
ncbi:MAG: radical SAM protein [Myxococcales bacterium]|nr:radical SAM protein [Myxococcales bacterium]MCB9581809.1 radical SAM protein [Polyangiaceae bacterium]